MSLNQSSISDFSEYYRWSQRTKIKYKLHYGWSTGRRFTAATRHNTSCILEMKRVLELQPFIPNANRLNIWQLNNLRHRLKDNLSKY